MHSGVRALPPASRQDLQMAPAPELFIMGATMNISAPKVVTFVLSLILVVLALVGHFKPVAYLTQYQFWLAVIGYALLALGVTTKGL